MMNDELYDEIIRDKNVKYLAKVKYNYDLTPGQCEIVRKIAFMEHRRLSISAMTRYGKSQCVAIAIALLIDFNENLKIAFIGPKAEQAGILRQYMAELILQDLSLLGKAQISASGDQRLNREASRKRLTFSNKCEYRVFSAEGDADRIMGFGADIVIKDEACLINRKANTKIMRMLGDNPEKSILIELYNPWDRDNAAYDHSIKDSFHVIQIGWQQAVAEGRTTEAFVKEQKEDMTPLEFEVLYESRFPDQSDDSLFSILNLKKAEDQSFGFDKELEEIEKVLLSPHKTVPGEYKAAKEEANLYKRIIACDPADMGKDLTVFYWGIMKENKFQLLGFYSEPKTDPMNLVGRIWKRGKDFFTHHVDNIILIDRIGIGTGPLSRLKELVHEQGGRKTIRVIGCHFGESAIKKDEFRNKKAENYFRLAAIFRAELIDIPKIKELKNQLMAMKWKLSSAAKKEVVDPPDYSPDYADALVYFCWKDLASLAFDFT